MADAMSGYDDFIGKYHRIQDAINSAYPLEQLHYSIEELNSILQMLDGMKIPYELQLIELEQLQKIKKSKKGAH